MMLGLAALVLVLAPSTAFAQANVATIVSAEEIQTVVSRPAAAIGK